MVTKKTSKEDVKKVSAPAAADVKKQPAKKAGSTAAKTAEKKTTAAAEKKSTAKKTVKADYTPVAGNKDVVASVLDIKAKNEAKKTAKQTKPKAAGAAQKAAVVEEKGGKAVSAKSKRDTVKENAQKAEAKKFMALKESEPEKECLKCCCFLGLKNMFAAWFGAYKKIFNYKTRSSRYDFWAYMLINLFISLLIAIPYQSAKYEAFFNGGEVSTLLQIVYWIVSVVMLLASLALFVRRLHDMGQSGWKGFFRPMTFSALGLIALTVIGNALFPDTTKPEEVESLSASLLGGGILVLLLVNFYYLCKTAIAAGFIEGEQVENAYGLPMFADDCTKAKILRYASLYTVIFVIYMTAMLVVAYYLSLAMLFRGQPF